MGASTYRNYSFRFPLLLGSGLAFGSAFEDDVSFESDGEDLPSDLLSDFDSVDLESGDFESVDLASEEVDSDLLSDLLSDLESDFESDAFFESDAADFL